jgi:hypothetical protein
MVPCDGVDSQSRRRPRIQPPRRTDCALGSGTQPIAIAKAAGKYRGSKASLTDDQAGELRERLTVGESITEVAKEYGISRQTVYNYKIA